MRAFGTMINDTYRRYKIYHRLKSTAITWTYIHIYSTYVYKISTIYKMCMIKFLTLNLEWKMAVAQRKFTFRYAVRVKCTWPEAGRNLRSPLFADDLSAIWWRRWVALAATHCTIINSRGRNREGFCLLRDWDRRLICIRIDNCDYIELMTTSVRRKAHSFSIGLNLFY